MPRRQCSTLEGRLIASSTATTLMHSASLRESLRALLIDIPLATMQQGDVFAQNDPFKGGIHANDIAVLRPVFAADGSGPHYFAGTIIHVADIGGGYAGGVAATAQDMFAEGPHHSPARLYRPASRRRSVDDPREQQPHSRKGAR